MTTIFHRKKKCAVCGSEQEYIGIGSTNAFGSPDLDTRPPKMKRATIYAWVQRCPECGYCASDISKSLDKANSVVRSKAYQDQLSDPSMPELANSFICKSIIEETAENYDSASWSLIHAAWACDDEENVESAKKCRDMAVSMIFKAHSAKQKIVSHPGTEIAILVDLLRRAGRFSEAKEIINKKRSEIDHDIILKVFDFQEHLLEIGDTACHTLSEAIKQKE